MGKYATCICRHARLCLGEHSAHEGHGLRVRRSWLTDETDVPELVLALKGSRTGTR